MEIDLKIPDAKLRKQNLIKKQKEYIEKLFIDHQFNNHIVFEYDSEFEPEILYALNKKGYMITYDKMTKKYKLSTHQKTEQINKDIDYDLFNKILLMSILK